VASVVLVATEAYLLDDVRDDSMHTWGMYIRVADAGLPAFDCRTLWLTKKLVCSYVVAPWCGNGTPEPTLLVLEDTKRWATLWEGPTGGPYVLWADVAIGSTSVAKRICNLTPQLIH